MKLRTIVALLVSCLLFPAASLMQTAAADDPPAVSEADEQENGQSQTAAPPDPKAAPPAVSLPGPVDEKSLGFGSTAADVEKLLGKPKRVAPGADGETWFYGLSSISFVKGRVVGWCQFNRPLPVNIGQAKPESPKVAIGHTAQQVVEAHGTPKTAATFGEVQVWFYDGCAYTLRSGKVTRLGYEVHVLDAHSATAARDLPKVWAGDLWTAYRENAVSADAKYLDKQMIAEGYVERVDRDINGVPFVELEPDEEYALTGVVCIFGKEDEDKLIAVEKDAVVEIKGLCKGLSHKLPHLRDVVLVDCTLVTR